MRTIQMLQNRAARIVINSKFDTPVTPLEKSLQLPTFNDIITKQLLQLYKNRYTNLYLNI